MTEIQAGAGTTMNKAFLERVASTWEIDPGKAYWHEDELEGSEAFSWWPGDFRQIARSFRHDSDPAVRIRIDTAFLRGFDVRSEPATSHLASIAHLLTSSYAWAYHPADLQEALKDKGPGALDPSRLWLTTTAYIRADTAGWLPEFVARMAILQPIIAQRYADEIAQSLNAMPDVSSDPSDPEAPPDGILGVFDEVFIPVGKEPNRWIDCEEFASFAEQWGRSDSCFGTGDPRGLSLEAPFGDDSALIRLHTDQVHPLLGNGLLATLQLPVVADEQKIAKLAAELNFMEATTWTEFPLLGCWHSRPLGDNFVAAFSMFVPNLLFQPLIATNAAIWMITRARWVRANFFSELVDQSMHEILERRLGLTP